MCLYPAMKTDTKGMEGEEQTPQSVTNWGFEKAWANSEAPASEVEGRAGGERQREFSVDGREAESLWDRSFSPLVYTHTHGTHTFTHTDTQTHTHTSYTHTCCVRVHMLT